MKAGVLQNSHDHGSGQEQGQGHGHGLGLKLFQKSKSKTPGAEEPAEFLPVTTRITAALPKQLRVLGMPAVKMLVEVLFFWEEEVNRWHARELDVIELEQALGGYQQEREKLDGEPGAGMGEEELKEEKERAGGDGKGGAVSHTGGAAAAES